MSVHVLEREAAQLHYEVHGSRSNSTPLLLTHGFAANSMMWQGNVPSFAQSRQVVTWDMRGHGQTKTSTDPAQYSQAHCIADMVAILDACAFPRALVGGLSLGGFLSLLFHLEHPERVEALLLFDTGPGFNHDRGRDRWNSYALARAAAFERDGIAALSKSPEVRIGAHDPGGLALAARGILVQHSADVIKSLSSIEVPTLILVGQDDAPFRSAADYMEARIQKSQEKVIEKAGHASNIDAPDSFNAAVLEFLEHLERLRA